MASRHGFPLRVSDASVASGDKKRAERINRNEHSSKARRRRLRLRISCPEGTDEVESLSTAQLHFRAKQPLTNSEREAISSDRNPTPPRGANEIARPCEEDCGADEPGPLPHGGKGGPGPSRRMLRYEAPGGFWYFSPRRKVRTQGKIKFGNKKHYGISNRTLPQLPYGNSSLGEGASVTAPCSHSSPPPI